MIHVEQVPPDPNDPRAAAVGESLRTERPGEHTQHREDDLRVSALAVNADGGPLGVASVRVPHVSGIAKVAPTGCRHDEEEGTSDHTE